MDQLNTSNAEQLNASRTSTTAQPRPTSKNPTQASKTSKAPTTVICAKAELQGNIHFGEGVIVHPMCKISADGGDINIGDYTIIEEFVTIVN